ncbi:hypothetical protein NCER_102347 [Vairimorpha ceranae BRL01]|uniref:Uncharacterized protein n=1 Tax=Vairimorpha ceranae (strain BRL01) TaxID=578460 RepID=C4VBW0_VAIC1|nr:hypothetical protein NCER_102347 [Vairimorpha ceranae BRL01]
MNDIQFNSNLSTDCIGKDLNRRNKNDDHDLFNFSSSTSATNDLVTLSFTRSTVIKYVSKKRHCASEESRNDTKRLKTLTSRKKLKTNNVSNIQTNGNEKALKSKRKIKNSRTTLKSQFKANERRLYEKYQQSEKNFRRFFRLKIKDQMPQFIKKLEISNLSDDLKQKSILALQNLSSFLDTIKSIKVITKKAKNKEDFLNSLNLACYQFSRYTDVSQKLLIFKLICNNLHKINDSVFCCIFSCNFYEINRLLFCIDRRFSSFYSRLFSLREIFDKNDQH